MSTDRYCACPYCESIFRLPEAKFKHKGGIVRCGSCREIFDANGNLVVREHGRFIPVSTVNAPITRTHGGAQGGEESNDRRPEPVRASDRPATRPDPVAQKVAERSSISQREASPDTKLPNATSRDADFTRADADPPAAQLQITRDESLNAETDDSPHRPFKKSRIEAGLLESEQRLSKELNAARDFLANISPVDSRSEPDSTPARDLVIDDVRNPFAEDPDSESEQDSKPSDQARNEPSFGPLNLEQDSEQDSTSESESHIESTNWSQRSELRSVLFADTEDPLDQVDDDVDIRLVTSGVTEANVSSMSLNPNSEMSGLDDTLLGRMSRNGVDDYINRRNRPLATIAWTMVSTGFLVLLALQFKYFFVQNHAQNETWRPYIAAFCKVADCEIPPRQDPFRFTLTHTKIDLHPREPGAIRITVKMVNEAGFDQPYPGLQLTLTDRVGRVVGRRTFLPDGYLPAGQENMVGKGELASVLFDLARPHEKAVGFVVDIIRDPV